MKKLYFISFLLMSFILNGQENIFFSEYAEGSSNNKYLEIFNNSAETIDLTQYAFPNVSNAPTTVGEYEYWNTFDDGSTIEPYGIFVIAHPEAEDPILAEADMTSFVYFSNGDDGFKLVYGTEESFTILDEIGDWQGDPGAGWDVAGVPSGTKDHTLVRKSSVQNGNTWSNSAGSTAEDSEWIVYDQNTWTYLGTHEIEASTACIPGPMNCSLGDGFVGLVMADIDNSDSGCSTDGYGDFSELSTELAQGQTVPVTITTGYINQYIKAWVDFNDDLVFGTDEVVIDNVLIAATGTTDVDAVIPAEAALGAHVMRFKANWNTEVPEDACEATTYGEVEDYTVVIVEAGLSIDEVDSLDMRIYPNPVDGNYVTIQSPIQGLIEVEVYTVTGRKVLQTVLTDDKLDVSSFNSGFYMVKVTINGQSKLSKLVVR